MSNMYGHRISKGELYLHGNYLKVGRSKNMLWKRFEILNYEVLIPPVLWYLILFVYQHSNTFDSLYVDCVSMLILKKMVEQLQCKY